MPFSNRLPDLITVLDLLKRATTDVDNVMELAALIPHVVSARELDSLRQEFDEYQLIVLPEIVSSKSDLLDKYWHAVSRVENEVGERRFPVLSKLAKAVISLPHSNAECEYFHK